MQAKKSNDLYAFDLDGTLVHRHENGEKYIPEDLLRAVHDVALKHHIVIATGRRYRATLEDLKVLPAMNFVIAHNGLVIRDGRGALTRRSTIGIDQVIQLARLVASQREDFFVMADGYETQIDYLFTKSALAGYRTTQMLYERCKNHCIVLDSLDDLKEFSHLPFLEVGAHGDPTDLVEQKNRLNALLPKGTRGFVVKNIGIQGFGALEIFSDEISKWSAVEWAKTQLGATRVIAVGDDENDIEMLKYADEGVAMGHAEPHVLKAAKHRTGGPKELTEWLSNFGKSS